MCANCETVTTTTTCGCSCNSGCSGCSSCNNSCGSTCTDADNYVVSISRDSLDKTLVRSVDNAGNITEWNDGQIRSVTVQSGAILVDMVGSENVVIEGDQLDFQYLKSITKNDNGSFDIVDSQGLVTRIPAGFPTRVSYDGDNSFTLATDDGQSIEVDVLDAIGSFVKCVHKDCDGNYVFEIESNGGCNSCSTTDFVIPASSFGVETDPVFEAERENLALNSTESSGVITLHNGDDSTLEVYSVDKIDEIIAGLETGSSHTPLVISVESLDYSSSNEYFTGFLPTYAVEWNDDSLVVVSAVYSDDSSSGTSDVIKATDEEPYVGIIRSTGYISEGITVELFYQTSSMDTGVSLGVYPLNEPESESEPKATGTAIATDITDASATIIYSLSLNGESTANMSLRQGTTVIAQADFTSDFTDAVYNASGLTAETVYDVYLNDEIIYSFTTEVGGE